METSGHDVRDGAPQFLYFLYFQAVFLYFIVYFLYFSLENEPPRYRSAKIAPNAYPDTSTEVSGRCLDISPSNLGRSGKKMSGISLGVMKYVYFGPEIGLCGGGGGA